MVDQARLTLRINRWKFANPGLNTSHIRRSMVLGGNARRLERSAWRPRATFPGHRQTIDDDDF
jgi:hypothetical protein